MSVVDCLVWRIGRFSRYILCWFLCLQILPIQAEHQKENTVKASHLVNFARFVKWQDVDGLISLCISDKAKPYAHLKDMDLLDLTQGNGLTLQLNPASYVGCQMVYIDQDSLNFMPDIAQLPEYTLSFSDIENALDKGYSVMFFVDEMKLRFSINKGLVKTGTYKISSKLMHMSRTLVK